MNEGTSFFHASIAEMLWSMCAPLAGSGFSLSSSSVAFLIDRCIDYLKVHQCSIPISPNFSAAIFLPVSPQAYGLEGEGAVRLRWFGVRLFSAVEALPPPPDPLSNLRSSAKPLLFLQFSQSNIPLLLLSPLLLLFSPPSLFHANTVVGREHYTGSVWTLYSELSRLLRFDTSIKLGPPRAVPPSLVIYCFIQFEDLITYYYHLY